MPELKLAGNSNTLKYLLGLIRRDLLGDPKLGRAKRELRMAKLSETARLLALSVGKTPETAEPEILIQGEAQFFARLKDQEFSTDASFHHLVRRDSLMHYAHKFGLLQQGVTRTEWDEVLDVAGYEAYMLHSIIAYARLCGLKAAEFTQNDLDEWKEQRLERENAKPISADRSESAFRRALRRDNLQKLFPMFNAAKRKQPAFSLPMEKMKEPLQADVRGIVEWALAEAESQTLRIGKEFLIQLETLCGYAVNILLMKHLTCLDPLLSKEFLTGYVVWLYEVRKRSRSSIRTLISGLHTVLLHHPRFAQNDITWWPKLLGQIEREPMSGVEARREGRSLSYEQHIAGLKKMDRARVNAKSGDPKTLAWMAHDQLIWMAAVMMVWHPRLIRICLVKGSSANLKQLPNDRPGLALTGAAKRARKEDKHAALWQFDFERQWGEGAFGFIIEPVAGLLDEYMRKQRPILIGKRKDPGTLFFTRRLTPLSKHTVNDAICRLTYKFAGRRVTADTIRISFSDYWLIERERDYLNLANILMIRLDSVQRQFDPDFHPSFNRRRSKR